MKLKLYFSLKKTKIENTIYVFTINNNKMEYIVESPQINIIRELLIQN